ncbi:MAG: histidinol-phosphate aminotransferase family protein [Oscillospiraceae bacterium]|nr:histidinol-phosphate aminotransferase family protein [Oscillospiraceae bacterium]
MPNKLQGFVPYKPLTGEYRVRLDVNESYHELPTDEVIHAVMEIGRVKLNRYPDPYATDTINEFSNLFGTESRYVTAGNGSDELIGLIAAGLLEKGSKVLTLSPDFTMYGFYSRLYELEVDDLPKNTDFEVDIDETLEYINNNNIKCLMFSNPCNPTSLGVEKSEVMRLVVEAGKKGVLIVVDEAYMDFWDESQSTLNEVSNYDNLIVLRTCSKSVALAGIRLGFAVACERITSALKTIKSPFNVNSLSQAIGAAVLSDTIGYRKSIAHIKESTNTLALGLLGLSKLGVFEKIYDTKTNFVFAKVEKAVEIYEFLLERGVAVRCFPPNHLRICAGTREEMNILCRELAVWQIQELEG